MKVRVLGSSRARRAIFAVVGIVALAAAAVAQGQLRFINDITMVGGGVTLWDPDNEYNTYETECEKGANTGYTPVSDGQYGGTSDSDTEYKADDAFDGGLMLQVNGERFRDPDGIGNWKNRSLRVSDNVGGFNVVRVEAGLRHTATLRDLIAIENPTGAGHTAHVVLNTNYGSDGSTELRRSSADPEHKLTKADRWIVTTDETANPTGDPPVTLVFSGPNAPGIDKVLAGPGGSGPGTEPECATVQFNTNVPAHGTRWLMFFAEMHAPVKQEAAFQAAQKFNNPRQHPGLTQDVPNGVLNRILNWDL